jgi:diaminohydroxyphosphoribosylaminopyrimidine deaminase / 5-amino-6-(5-phosphoribosylamino)uracil reductase
MIDDNFWMKSALALAVQGRGAVEPNPMVGAIVLNSHGEKVGEGWHRKFGQAHAEIIALQAAGDSASGGTLYVTLEPCCHTGKTPPCTEAVLQSGVRRVVIAMADPFPKVAGNGIAILRQAGIEVVLGPCELEAQALNAPYLKLLSSGRPWVHLKWAMTLDGKIATRTGESRWISGVESRAVVHELRGRMDAIIVGAGTVLADDPSLTARPPGPRVPTRVVVSGIGRLPDCCQLRQTARDVPVLVFTAELNVPKLSGWANDGAEIIGLPSTEAGLDIDTILEFLGTRGMTNVLVEGGARLLGSIHDANLADEVHVFIAPKLFGGTTYPPIAGQGVEQLASGTELEEITTRILGCDVYLNGKVRRSTPQVVGLVAPIRS